ncbi:DUF1501 domain-containing protein [Thalassoroseus pseudoceratinae]|uniref:DUF1501 domain-containing protein n=1 Tax=Thalassoroseus pseudoceratinae TaxID=2713176 RepID=UPI0014235713|nr:DUF1501 domain-containing protein [Thalassoroseus pseudoceratinae]
MTHHRTNRRQFLTSSGLGAGAVALNSLLASEPSTPSDAKRPYHPPTADRVIFLFMAGGPSQVDTFDPKPELDRLAGKDVPESIAANVPKIKRAGLKNLMKSPWSFHQHGESGLSVSTLFPQVAQHADDLCVIRSMTHRNPVHGPGECVALTGSANGERPSLGAWSVYGLGRATDNLPAFVTMNLHSDGMQYPQAAGWKTGFLPARFQGTVVDPSRGIQHVQMPNGTTPNQRRKELDVIEKLNRQFARSTGGHSELEARIHSYEMAFRMQSATPELFDIGGETRETHELYGLANKSSATVGRGCLLARRMIERGVRFVQVRVGGWDAHGNIQGNHERMAARTDQPVAALLDDLRRRGLLDRTLVVWGGEFGRTPTMEGRGKGRDHSPAAYCCWLAGGGVRGGQTIGQTDALGYTVSERPVTPQDFHATILHALGLNSDHLVFNHHGLRETPLGVVGGGPVLEAFL